MDKFNDKNELALLKYSIIAPYINGEYEDISARNFSALASKKDYYFKGVKKNYSSEVIRKWIRNYQKNGYNKLVRKERSDYQGSRKMDDDTRLRVIKLKNAYPKMTGKAIYQKLIKEKYVTEDSLNVRTVTRFISHLNNDYKIDEHIRRSYTFEHINDCWQSDTSSGPYIIVDGKKYKTYIIAFLDDHSRYIVGAQVFFNDTALNMQKTLKKAIKENGVPKILYVDNGGPYSNIQLKIICANLGINLKNTKPYDPQSKGKIERFFRGMKDGWMNTFDWNKIKSIEELNEQLQQYIITYNKRVHSSTKQTPNDIYFNNDTDVRRINDIQLRESFMHTVLRCVDKVGLVSINKNIYEVDYDLIKQKLHFKYDPEDMSVIYYGNKEYKIVDKVGNSKKKRKKNVDYSKIVNKENEEILEYEPR